MTAARRNITIEQGATFTYNLIYKDSGGVPVNLTGYSARMQVRKNVNSTDTLLDLNTDNGAIVLGGSAGTIDITATATETATIASKIGVYDLEIESASGVVTRLVEGDITINPEVTR